MRKGLSLIELIFTIVIIAVVFTVIPKIVLSLNKADSFVIRQDAMFNGISMMKMISKLPWDENNTNSRDILHVNKGNVRFKCDTNSTRRDGGFISGRTCENNQAAISIEKSNMQNDIGDFDMTDINISKNSKKIYDLNITVRYTLDNDIVFDYNIPNRVIIDLNKSTNDTNTTNLKRVKIVVNYAGKKARKRLTQFNYISSNIGQMTLNKRSW